ncbi:MAG TPA: GNAT family N-acetyltransferase [Acidobacteriota bacterium]
MEIIIRNISEEDAGAVNQLSTQLGYEMPIDQTLANIRSVLATKGHNAFVALHENKIVGWIGVAEAMQIESAPFSEIRGVIVDEQYRGHGIGKLLIEKVKEWSKETGNKILRLRCNVIRKEAHLFYRHLGFNELKEQKVFEMKV